MSHPISQVSTDANALYAALTADVTVDTSVPAISLPTDFSLPSEVGNPAFDPVDRLELADLTTQTVDGTGVFDGLMKAMSAHLTDQYEKGRITGADYAKVYLGMLQVTPQYAVQYLLGKDRAYLENLQLQETIRLTQAQRIKAAAELQLARGQIVQLQLQNARLQYEAYTARNQYALSKMELVTGYNGILASEAQIKLLSEQFETARAQTLNTRSDGSTVAGIIGVDRLIKEAQKRTAEEQADAARAQVRDTLFDGTVVAGILKFEKDLKAAQAKLVNEQYEGARGQVRGTLSDNSAVGGMIGTQMALYNQQITSYKRDGENKMFKAILDSWIARKTIDDAVTVPTGLDTISIDQMITTMRGHLGI